jgi:transketolase
VLRASDHDQVTLIGAGVTVHACLRAADLLQQEGIHARVVDCYSIEPIDGATLGAAARHLRPPGDRRRPPPRRWLGGAVTD